MMITPTILFKELGKWVENSDRDERFQLIQFTGTEAVAMTRSAIAVVRDYESEPHYATPEGVKVDGAMDLPDYKRVMLQDDSILWGHILKCSHPRNLLTAWKRIFDQIGKLIRTGTKELPVVVLEKRAGCLSLYAVTECAEFKVVLLNDLVTTGESPEPDDWYAAYDIRYFIKTFEFLSAIGAGTFELRVGKHSSGANIHVLDIRTDEILTMTAPVQLVSKYLSRADKLIGFMNREHQNH